MWRQRVRSWRDLTVAPGTRFEGRATVTIPATGMHSFASEHNAVGWSLVVRGVPDRWPPFARAFPLVVLPAPTVTAPVEARGEPQATT